MQRSITLKIIRASDDKITWEELGYLLRGLSLKICRMSNFCMTHHLLHALKLETEMLNPKGNLYCYPHLAEEYPEVPAGIVCAAESRARKLFKRCGAKVLRSEMSLPSFRKDNSIPIPVAGYRILQDGDTNYAEIQLLSRQGAKTQKLPGRIRLTLADNWRDKAARPALQKLAAGKIRRGVASLYRAKNDWYLCIPYEMEAANTGGDFEPGLVMGVAFGVYNALVYGFNTLLKRGAISGEEILSHQAKVKARRKKIQEQYPWSGRKGQGREDTLKPLRHLHEAEKNYRELVNHRYAKWVVDIAVKNRCGEIHLDDGHAPPLGKNKILLSRWSLYDLKNKICRKAEEKGIRVTECSVPDLRTRCSHCGTEQVAGNHKRRFLCADCGYGSTEKNRGTGYISVDYNAARNLAMYDTGKNEPDMERDLSPKNDPAYDRNEGSREELSGSEQ